MRREPVCGGRLRVLARIEDRQTIDAIPTHLAPKRTGPRRRCNATSGSLAGAVPPIEVADSTLRYDREIKVPLYASYAIPETWLVDVAGERLTRFVEPTRSGYARSETVSDLRAVEVAALPGTRFDLSRLF